MAIERMTLATVKLTRVVFIRGIFVDLLFIA